MKTRLGKQKTFHSVRDLERILQANVDKVASGKVQGYDLERAMEAIEWARTQLNHHHMKKRRDKERRPRRERAW